MSWKNNVIQQHQAMKSGAREKVTREVRDFDFEKKNWREGELEKRTDP